MLFPTTTFAVFFLLVFSVNWLVRRNRQNQKLFLLAASYVFYGWFDWRFLGLIVASSLLNFLAGEAIGSAGGRARKRWLIAGVLANVGFLGFFKYYNFFIESLSGGAALLGLELHLPLLQVMLPVGISFYTFQGIAYIADVHLEHGPRARSLLDFLLFIGFFPQLVAGPICRSRDLLPQLLGEAPAEIPDLSRAISLIASGLFKKMVLATFIGTQLVNDAFIAPENYSSLELLLGAYGYTAMVYCDFSGYTDLARGLALLLGFHIPENFEAPLAATNIGEFWRRWHLSYSRWLRDYIYFPLGGARAGRWRCYFNLMVTFVVGGLWHGAHWKFVIWGAVHGLALVLYKASLDVRRDLGLPIPRKARWPWAVLGWLYTFHLCAFARILFRCPDLETAGAYFSGLLELTAQGNGVELGVVLAVAFGVGLNFFGRPIREWFIRFHEGLPAMARPVAWIAAGMILLAVQPGDVVPFIYFQF